MDGTRYLETVTVTIVLGLFCVFQVAGWTENIKATAGGPEELGAVQETSWD